MLFKYEIKIEVSSVFDAPLLGADTTIFARDYIHKILPNELKEMYENKETERIVKVGVSREIIIKMEKKLGSAKK